MSVTDRESDRDGGRPVRVGRPKRSSVGLAGIAETVRYGLDEMGARRSVTTLLEMNQSNGFDCPSCALADPEPSERKRVEFC